MERLTQRKNVLLGYIPQISFQSPSSSPKTSSLNSGIDFDDVFGGPPRRFSNQERRCSFNEAMDSRRQAEEGKAVSRNSWPGLSEKPVFGNDSANRWRCQSDDFFDDIFRADDSYNSPRRADRNSFSSTPGSLVSSPARRLPLNASLPAPFSLPAKLTKAGDFPLFATGNSSSYKQKDIISNGASHLFNRSVSISRFSSQGRDELSEDVQPRYHQNLLSHEASLSNEDFSNKTKCYETETPSNSSKFHFSIYKWADRGVPLPFGGANSSKSKEKTKTEKYLSSNGKIESHSIVSELPTSELHDIDSLFMESGNSEIRKIKGEKQDIAYIHTGPKPCQIVEEAVPDTQESKSLNAVHRAVEKMPDTIILSNRREEIKLNSLSEIGLSVQPEKEISGVTEEACKPASKSLCSLLNDDIDGRGDDEINGKVEGKQSVVKMTKESRSNVDSKNVKKHDGKIINSEVNKISSQGSPTNSGDIRGRNRVKGKVKEFVNIFNREAIRIEKQNFRWKDKAYGANKEASFSTTGMDKKTHLHNVNKMPNSSFMEDDNFKQSEKQQSHVRTTNHITKDDSSSQKDASSFSESFPNGSRVGNTEEPFPVNFLVTELSLDEEKLVQTREDYEDFHVLDDKIRQWSNGKKGNIRSMLSTLHYVLWPESGWKPVPLVDIIEGSGVKRSYQKALLCLHPDKLQQKGATSHQKYTAEKVFDILQEAWDHFNSLGSSF